MTAIGHVLLLFLTAGPGLEQRLGAAVCRLDIDRSEIPLSGELRLVVRIQGPAPVEVEPPRPLTRSPNWRVRAGPPTTTPLSDGREQWEQSFRLEPFQAGSRVPLPLEPIRYRTGNELRDWMVTWEPQSITVTTAVSEGDLGQARSVTDIEREQVESGPSRWHWVMIIGPAFVAAAAVLAARVWLRRRAVSPQLSPLAQALAGLHQIESQGIVPGQLPQIADLVRAFLEAQFQLLATRQTTAEFADSLRRVPDLSNKLVAAIHDLLARCDLVKFAGAQPAAAECAEIMDMARLVIAESAHSAKASENARTIPSR